MKRYDNKWRTHEKYQAQRRKREQDGGGFRCSHCRQFVVANDLVMGTANRNHCNWCLWSKHVDNAKGDRRSNCGGGMRPIGLTFKHEGYGKRGEIMLIHLCSACAKISINRVARDDPEQRIEEVFADSHKVSEAAQRRLDRNGIYLLNKSDRGELQVQLFGEG